MQNCEELTTINEHSSILPQIELNEDSASNSDIESQPEVQVLDINNKINSFPSRLKSQQSSKEKRSPGHGKNIYHHGKMILHLSIYLILMILWVRNK
ncbi:unnamed protein product [Rotaria magnacalcarata]|uniref:Uncharacterized protein n=1 Tax=Rotaria magnacalcarata TaxID=392030 RepID=A0A816AQD4_9BILA|nr:unnamed protein product [Rotaria magnacalcarata]